MRVGLDDAAHHRVAEIGDGGLRERFLHYLKFCETGDEPDEFDPFGLGGADDSEEE